MSYLFLAMRFSVAGMCFGLAGFVLFTATAKSDIPTTMRAVVSTGAGSKEGDFSKVKLVTDHPVPQPGSGQVLIKVAKSSINPVDYKLLTGTPGPSPKVLGFDVAGTIAQVGSGCTRLKAGDAVWADLGKYTDFTLEGIQLGAWAEYAVADESQVALKPAALDNEAAGSLPLVALTDYQALKKVGAPWKNRHNLSVVITSGSGGTGIPAIQLAKAYGAAHIIVSASASHTALLESIGATSVIDYHKASLWDVLPANSVDIVYDNYGAAGTADKAVGAIRAGGAFIFLPGKGGAISTKPKEGVTQMSYGLCDASRGEDLAALAALANEDNLKAVVQEHFALEDIVKALNESMAGHVVGKISISVAKEPLDQSVMV